MNGELKERCTGDPPAFRAGVVDVVDRVNSDILCATRRSLRSRATVKRRLQRPGNDSPPSGGHDGNKALLHLNDATHFLLKWQRRHALAELDYGVLLLRQRTRKSS